MSSKKFNMIIIGDSFCGKTSFHSYVNQKKIGDEIPTVGCDFAKLNIES
jgi:hypothetical protein